MTKLEEMQMLIRRLRINALKNNNDDFELRMLDFLCKYVIIEERGNDGSHYTKGEHGRFTGSTKFSSGGSSLGIENSGKKKIENAFRNCVNSKSSQELVNTVIENHESLAKFTPREMKFFLESCGYDVKPLGSKSSLKGQRFEDGGGYRISFGGDGYFQYHPQKASHHKNAYWKIGNGERGLHRYEMDGRIKND